MKLFPGDFCVLEKGTAGHLVAEGKEGDMELGSLPRRESVACSHSGQEGAQAPGLQKCRQTEKGADNESPYSASITRLHSGINEEQEGKALCKLWSDAAFK